MFTQCLLIIHIISGAASLLSGLLAMISRKGGKLHRSAGKAFFISMILIGVTAIILSLVKPNSFLFMVGIFSLYLNIGGYRSTIPYDKRSVLPDLTNAFAGAVNAGFMLVSMKPVLLSFAFISFIVLLADLRETRKRSHKTATHTDRLRKHSGMMIGAFIATLTAFLVVNVKGGTWMIWLVPTIVCTPMILYWNSKLLKKATVKASGTALGILLCANAIAQPYTEGHTRHRFAQLNMGSDIRLYSASRTKVPTIENGAVKNVSLESRSEQRIIIGGTHFWGHADLFIAFPALDIGEKKFQGSIETGARIFPWRITDRKIRPFAGVSWQPMVYQSGNGASDIQYRYPFTLGATYLRNKHMLNISLGYIPFNNSNYQVTENHSGKGEYYKGFLSFGYKFMIETTLSAEESWSKGLTKKLTDTLSKLGRLNGLTVAMGVSSAFLMKSSNYNDLKTYRSQHKISSIFPEFGMGYYFHKPDLQISLIYRKIKSTTEAFGGSQELIRKALTLEVFKFFTDYHGFAAFAGPVFSYENLKLHDRSPMGAIVNNYEQMFKPGLSAGWDIRPDDLQFFYLRTNIRWIPDLTMFTSGQTKFNADQLEVNFIQLVLFPGRML